MFERPKKGFQIEIVCNADGSLLVPVLEGRHREIDDQGSQSSQDSLEGHSDSSGTGRLHPGEGGYDEALAEWDLQ
jgi:hypothetical protein